MPSPLVEHLEREAVAALDALVLGPIPRRKLSLRVAGELLGQGWAEEIDHPSTDPTLRGQFVVHLRLTEAGRQEIARHA